MGKRSRKRGDGADVSVSATTREERDAARRRRAEAMARREASGAPAARRRPGRTSFEDRPPAPWGSFPLVELCVLAGLILMVLGFLVVRGERGATMGVGGLALASLGGLELSIREHFAGFRSHTTLLAAATGFAAGALVYLITRDRTAPVPAALVVFVGSYLVYRQVFVRRSGVGFRR
jgi:hypothetical protein